MGPEKVEVARAQAQLFPGHGAREVSLCAGQYNLAERWKNWVVQKGEGSASNRWALRVRGQESQ